MLAAEFATVLSKSSAGAPDGPLRNSAVEEVLRRSAAGGPRAEHDAAAIVAVWRNRRAGIGERQLRRGDRVNGGAIHPPHLHRRHPRRRRRSRRSRAAIVDAAAGCVEPADRRDAAPAVEQRVAKRRMRRAEHRHDADARHDAPVAARAVRYHCCNERSSLPHGDSRHSDDRRSRFSRRRRALSRRRLAPHVSPTRSTSCTSAGREPTPR